MPNASAKLVVIAGPLSGMEFPLLDPVTTLGRDASSDIVLDDRSISRSHARIERANGGFLVTDLDSQNGTVFDGRRITQAMVPPGGRVLFGKVPCELQVAGAVGGDAHLPVAQPAGGDWSALPAQARPLTPEDLLRAAGSEAISPQEARRREEARRRRGTLIYIASLAGVVALGLLAYVHIGSPPEPPRRGITIDVGQEGLVGISGAVAERGQFTQIIVEDDVVATAEVDDEIPWLVAVQGRTPGVTDVVLRNATETVCIVTVRVFAPVKSERDPWRNLTNEERLRLAQALVAQGQNAEEAHLWHALKRFDDATRILRPLQPAPPLRDIARDGSRRVERAINLEYQRLKDLFKTCYKIEDWEGAARYLQLMQDLVPDAEDRRWQRADILMKFVMERLDRRRGLFGRQPV